MRFSLGAAQQPGEPAEGQHSSLFLFVQDVGHAPAELRNRRMRQRLSPLPVARMGAGRLHRKAMNFILQTMSGFKAERVCHFGATLVSFWPRRPIVPDAIEARRPADVPGDARAGRGFVGANGAAFASRDFLYCGVGQSCRLFGLTRGGKERLPEAPPGAAQVIQREAIILAGDPEQEQNQGQSRDDVLVEWIQRLLQEMSEGNHGEHASE